MFDSTHRPSKFEGFTHNRAVIRFPVLRHLSGSQDTSLSPLPSCGSSIWSAAKVPSTHREARSLEGQMNLDDYVLILLEVVLSPLNQINMLAAE